MEIYYLKDKVDIPHDLQKSIATIGMFDGIHKGHMELINKVFESKLSHMAITFDNYNKTKYVLMNLEEKKKRFEELGFDYLVILDFAYFSDMNFKDFIKCLKKLHVTDMVIGKDFRFGYKREGDYIDIENNFKTVLVSDLEINGVRASTTNIKSLIEARYFKQASVLLGYKYSVTGKVVSGSQVGRQIGIRTANVDYQNHLLPKTGVYYVLVYYNDNIYKGVCNIGHNPTINYQEEIRFEINILDFEGELVGSDLKIEFKEFLREEKVFESKEELIDTINSNILYVKNN